MIKSINVLGVEYRVKVCKLSKSLYGDCDTDKKVIRINKAKDQKDESLVHEVVHAALYESGLVHIIHTIEGLEESIVRAVEHGLKTAELIPESDFSESEDCNGETG